MLTCTAVNCVLPARWRPSIVVMRAKHWGDDASSIEPEMCFCELHKSEATVDKLFNDVSRRAIDVSFMNTRRVPPDWSRATITWAAVDPRQKTLFIYAVYRDPPDFPGKFVVRRCAPCHGGVLPDQTNICVKDTLAAARAEIPQRLCRYERAPQDDEKIVEVWL